MRQKKSNPRSTTGVPLLTYAREELGEAQEAVSPQGCARFDQGNGYSILRPHVQTAEVPEVILKLNEDYKDLLPCSLPPGLPPSRPTDHRIYFPEKYDIQLLGSTDWPLAMMLSCRSS